mmetsp:Transcript_11665/g.24033  ORF Transcript_11665/g.24033 Transcript_11665/m.24033 type:complete len:439 (-) Transcript_11665:681-1997(-)
MSMQPSPQRQHANTGRENMPTAIAEALSLDVQVLTLLLRRNRAAQHRSRYYRRLAMMTKCLSRNGIDDGPLFFSELLRCEIRHEVDWIESMSDRDRRKRARGDEGRWAIKKSQSAVPPTTSLQDRSESSNDDESSFSTKILMLSQALTIHLPEVLSRILYAAEALYSELSRGYFVPFCTVAVASISRIRALLMRMGREGCIELGRCLTVVDGVLELERNNDDTLWHGRLNLSSVRRTANKIRGDNDINVGVGWGDWAGELMEKFLEVDAMEHEKGQRARQRKGALRRGMSDISGTSGLACSDADGKNDNDNVDDTRDIDVPAESSGNLNHTKDSDLGESVDIGQNETESVNQKKNWEEPSLDVNEQILQMMKVKKQRQPSSPSYFEEVSKSNGKTKIKKNEKKRNNGMRTSSSNEQKKTKKNKRKRKRNAVDDIFAGL